jgi:electron transfer flavoprotein alpha/beta subunit
MEDDLARRGRVEHAVDDDTMEVEVRVEGGTEAVDAKAPVVCSPTGDCCTMESLIES